MEPAALVPGLSAARRGLVIAHGELVLGLEMGIGMVRWLASVALACATLAGCSRPSAEGPPPCPPIVTAAPGPDAIDKVMDEAMHDVLTRRAPPDPEARERARRAIVVSCLQTVASSVPAKLPVDEAATRAAQACGPVIDRYNHAQATDAAFRGDTPPGPAELASARVEFVAEAARQIRDMRAGRCPPG